MISFIRTNFDDILKELCDILRKKYIIEDNVHGDSNWHNIKIISNEKPNYWRNEFNRITCPKNIKNFFIFISKKSFNVNGYIALITCGEITNLIKNVTSKNDCLHIIKNPNSKTNIFEYTEKILFQIENYNLNNLQSNWFDEIKCNGLIINESRFIINELLFDNKMQKSYDAFSRVYVPDYMPNIFLPFEDKMDEGAYNIHICNKSDKIKLMDKQLLQIQNNYGQKGKIELCDIRHLPDNIYIHVKRQGKDMRILAMQIYASCLYLISDQCDYEYKCDTFKLAMVILQDKNKANKNKGKHTVTVNEQLCLGAIVLAIEKLGINIKIGSVMKKNI